MVCVSKQETDEVNERIRNVKIRKYKLAKSINRSATWLTRVLNGDLQPNKDSWNRLIQALNKLEQMN